MAAAPSNPLSCSYVSPDGTPCADAKTQGDYCLWHAGLNEYPEDLKNLLELRAASARPMTGFCLQHAELGGINLVSRRYHEGYDLSHADLYRADLRDAHLYQLNLFGASLLKANLRGANLNRANLERADLLGAQLDHAKLEGVNWGQQVLQEQQALAEPEGKKRHDLLQQAEEVYRNLRKVNENQGLFEAAGNFFHREMIMRRYQMPLRSSQRLISKAVDLFCGYGERPLRVIGFSLGLILTFALLYALAGVQHNGEMVGFRPTQSLSQNLFRLLECIYFSVVTFTTLGYGDFTPHGLSRLLAALEAFMGSFTMALFVVVFVKKMTR